MNRVPHFCLVLLGRVPSDSRGGLGVACGPCAKIFV